MNTVIEKKQRDIGPELLRLMAMVMIILSHFSTHGDLGTSDIQFNNLFLSILPIGGNVGVDIFILITGFYTVTSTFKAKKLSKLICETVFYSVLTYLICCVIGTLELRKKHLILSLIPFLTDKGNWFIITYVILFCLSPFLNSGLQKLNRRALLSVILFMLSVWSIIPAVFKNIFNMPDYGISTVMWFICVYCIGAYLRLYPIKLMGKKFLSLGLLFGTGIIIIAVNVLNYLGYFNGSSIKQTIYSVFGEYLRSSPMSISFAFFAFVFFKQIKGKPCKFIYACSGTTLGIYLIHDSNWFRRTLWDNILNVKSMVNSNYLILFAIGCAFAILICCIVIDLLRQNLLEKPFFNSKLYEKLEKKIGNDLLKIIK